MNTLINGMRDFQRKTTSFPQTNLHMAFPFGNPTTKGTKARTYLLVLQLWMAILQWFLYTGLGDELLLRSLELLCVFLISLLYFPFSSSRLLPPLFPCCCVPFIDVGACRRASRVFCLAGGLRESSWVWRTYERDILYLIYIHPKGRCMQSLSSFVVGKLQDMHASGYACRSSLSYKIVDWIKHVCTLKLSCLLLESSDKSGVFIAQIDIILINIYFGI